MLKNYPFDQPTQEYNLPLSGRFKLQFKMVDMKTKTPISCLEINGYMKDT